MFRSAREIFLPGRKCRSPVLEFESTCTPDSPGTALAHSDVAEGGVMAIATLVEIDTRIRDLVMRELEWDAAVDASAIGVAATDRTVTLTGYVDTYLCKLAAERAAKRVRGVRAVANDIEVRPKVGRTDADIARDVVRSLELRSAVPDNVQATVHHGYVTLTGETMW